MNTADTQTESQKEQSLYFRFASREQLKDPLMGCFWALYCMCNTPDLPIIKIIYLI